ncbi:Unknown protein [Striga hermonthica]|uniref:F-box domain-containing protein n=1 Tax=Striga hermonthica TaxID=68872 RepID=A0A9N7MWZ0_STRHE|nr:Unknown protein [Striga hermonthica]
MSLIYERTPWSPEIPESMMRQPPPPRLSKAASKEEGNAQIIGGRTLSPRMCSRRKRPITDIDSLSDELLMEVLARVPGKELYEARLVCREWYHLLHTRDFMRFYLQHAPYGLLFECTILGSYLMLSQGGVRVEITKLGYKRRLHIASSCNGLWLGNQLGDRDNLYVTNPTTGQVVLLPPLVNRVQSGFHAMGYVPASMEYKAVIFWPASEIEKRMHCYILNVGVDKSWRKVEFESTTPLRMDRLMISEGFMHWTHPPTNQVSTLNLETEIFTETPGPIPLGGAGNVNNIYLWTGRYLSLLRCYGDNSWDIWEMSRPERGEWRKKVDFSLAAHKGRFEQLGLRHDDLLIPVGWVKYLELLALKSDDKEHWTFVFLCNLVTQEFDKIELPLYMPLCSIMVHTSSLEWLDAAV